MQTICRRGGASSADDFRFLLDELNAYSHDLHSAVKLVPLRRQGREVGHRDGLAALMSFVMAYVDTARQSVPATWEDLQRPEVRKPVGDPVGPSREAPATSCCVPSFGQDAGRPVAFLADPKNGAGLAELVGRAPLRPCQDPGQGPRAASSRDERHDGRVNGLHGRHRRHRRADGAGKAQRRRGQKEAAAVVGAQPVRQLREAPQLAQVDAGPEQAVLVQRQGRALAGPQSHVVDLHRVVVGDEGDQLGLGDPLLQAPSPPSRPLQLVCKVCPSGFLPLSRITSSKPVRRSTKSPASTAMPSAAMMRMRSS